MRTEMNISTDTAPTALLRASQYDRTASPICVWNASATDGLRHDHTKARGRGGTS